MVRFGEGDGHILDGLGLLKDGLVGEIFKAVVEHPGSLGEAADVAHAVFLHTLGAQDDADVGHAALGSRVHQAVAASVEPVLMPWARLSRYPMTRQVESRWLVVQ